MTVYSAPITQVGIEPAYQHPLHVDVRYCLRISFGVNQQLYIISHDDVIPLLPAGAVYSAARLADVPMPDINRNAGMLSNKATTPSTTYLIADVGDDLTERFADKNLNNESTYNRVIEDYEFSPEGPIEWGQPIYTGIIQNHERTYNGIMLETSDFNRKIDDDIFEPLTWKLKESISKSDDVIKTTLPVSQIDEYDLTWEHGDWYLENPGKVGGYAKIGDEVFFYEKLENINGVACFTGVNRGQCKTEPEEFTVESGVEESNRPEIQSYFVLHESATDIPRMLATGQATDGNRALPKNCHAGETSRWLELGSFAKHSSPLKLRFEISTKQSCRDFYEKEVMTLMGAVMATNGRGQLKWLTKQLPTDTESGQIVFDETNCATDVDLVLRHIKNDITPSIKFNYEWSERYGKPLQSIIYRDTIAEQKYNIPEGQRLREFTFKGLRTGIHTGTQLKKLASTFGDFYFDERQQIVLESLLIISS